MLRYLDVLRRARPAGCGWPGCRAATIHASCGRPRGFAAGIGALFLRAYERGERVWLGDALPRLHRPDATAWHEAGVGYGEAVDGGGERSPDRGGGGGEPPW